uniref:WD repeat-containing protein 25 isoform X2 n=1 Tax=Podarcis muralis TaxID=64176 RepID=UPI0010A03DC6|nr:WD repeat-containing protein 25 isoform X2 [Podarcis muralis]
MKASLVAYEDSDSETEDGESEDATASGINVTNFAMTAAQPCDGTVKIPDSTFQPVEYIGSSRSNMFHEDTLLRHLKPNKNYMATTLLKKIQPDTPRLFSANDSCSQKRPCDYSEDTIQGLRPYIPKRLRQEKNPLLCEAEDSGQSTSCVAKPDTAGEQISFNTSQYIMPYIGSKYGITEIPRNLVFQMSDHSGPVNVVQWCPVQKWSHMLLSASMDKTVKVWDAVDRGRCLKTYLCHTCAVRAAQWTPCGRGVLSGGFDSMLHLTDIETGAQTFSSRTDFRISTLKFHPLDPNVCICGGFSPEVKAWDIRSSKVIKVYKAAVQQTLDIMFLPEGKEFLTSTDAVSQDSADRTIIAWDFHTAAKISNQIYHMEGCVHSQYTEKSISTFIEGKHHSLSQNNFHGLPFFLSFLKQLTFASEPPVHSTLEQMT